MPGTGTGDENVAARITQSGRIPRRHGAAQVLEVWVRRLKPCVWLVGIGLLGLTACTEFVYVKPDVADKDVAADYEECLKIARKRDRPMRFGRAHHVCMIAKGYELVPPNEQPSG